jgi:hypothetical protein
MIMNTLHDPSMSDTDTARSAGHIEHAPPKMAIVKVKDLLADAQLTIPDYQRPYKWTTRHVGQLISDICKHSDKSSYRLGTVVFHQEGALKNIVDGQQRIISLTLTIRAIIARCMERIKDADLKKRLRELSQSIQDQPISSEIAQNNIQQNYSELERLVDRPEFTEQHVEFLLDQCEVVTFTLEDVSEAFQFFDSQNARGKDLDPHDLLKAYHLREFMETDQTLKAQTVETWEDSNSEDLAHLFANYLFRIRQWSQGGSARYFGKAEAELFKGVNLEKQQIYPYLQQLNIAHHWIDQYNAQYERRIDRNAQTFPFHLDQIIINGRRFFEMITFYQVRVREVATTAVWKGKKDSKEVVAMAARQSAWREKLSVDAQKILKTLGRYSGRNRTGDRYVRTIFDCLLIAYYDKFGEDDISLAIGKIFIWAYSLRLTRFSVKLASMDNHVVRDNNLFRELHSAITPSDFTRCQLPKLEEIGNASKVEEIVEIFEDMRYYERPN